MTHGDPSERTAPLSWQRFARHGTVTAERLDRPLTWTADGVHELVAQPGDWRISDGERVWTVDDAAFQRSYEPAGGGFGRSGVVRARPAQVGEVVQTLEGEVRAGAGDWVVEGEGGECWPVSAEHFARTYRAV